MARIGDKAARVGEHADKPAEQSHQGEGIELVDHAGLLVKEPPSRTELDLSGENAVLEVAGHGGNQFIVAGIEIVENSLREIASRIKPVKQPGKIFCHGEVAHGVIAGIRTKPGKHTAVVVAYGTVVKLLCPSLFRIHDGKFIEHGRFEP